MREAIKRSVKDVSGAGQRVSPGPVRADYQDIGSTGCRGKSVIDSALTFPPISRSLLGRRSGTGFSKV
ncbi:MAG: hypothetical protein WBB23_07280 [Desulforhopalus sp.]